MQSMRSDAEILDYIERIKGSDMLGTSQSDVIDFLPFEAAKPWLKEDATPDKWEPAGRDEESIKAKILSYMPFAWEKACDERGLSAWRSMNHMRAWLWMLGDDAASSAMDRYSHYGKPQLRAICERYGWDWRAWDNDQWSNDEGGPYCPADQVARVNIFNSAEADGVGSAPRPPVTYGEGSRDEP